MTHISTHRLRLGSGGMKLHDVWIRNGQIWAHIETGMRFQYVLEAGEIPIESLNFVIIHHALPHK